MTLGEDYLQRGEVQDAKHKKNSTYGRWSGPCAIECRSSSRGSWEWPPALSAQSYKSKKLNSAYNLRAWTQSYPEPPDEKSVWLIPGFKPWDTQKRTCAELWPTELWNNRCCCKALSFRNLLHSNRKLTPRHTVCG